MKVGIIELGLKCWREAEIEIEIEICFTLLDLT